MWQELYLLGDKKKSVLTLYLLMLTVVVRDCCLDQSNCESLIICLGLCNISYIKAHFGAWPKICLESSLPFFLSHYFMLGLLLFFKYIFCNLIDPLGFSMFTRMGFASVVKKTSIISTLCHPLCGGDPMSLLLLLHQQLVCCWLGQQGVVHLKRNNRLCYNDCSLLFVCNPGVMYMNH